MVKLFMVAELVIFVADENGVDESGMTVLKLFKNVGVTSFVATVHSSHCLDAKQMTTAKKTLQSRLTAQVSSLSKFEDREMLGWM